MDDATQKLVDEVMRHTPMRITDEGIVMQASEIEAMIAAALEAAQRPPVNPVVEAIDAARDSIARGELASVVIDTDDYPQRPPVSGDYTHVVNLARASEAADKGFDALVDYLADLPTIEEWRPPVSPEVRAEMKSVLHEAMHKGAYSLGEQLDDLIDALLARFSVPSQPVYDEEKIARVLIRASREFHGEYGACIDEVDAPFLASALVAALRGGEPTREEERP